MSTAPNHEGETDTSRERGAQDVISSLLLWVHPRWKCLLTRIRKEITNLLLAFKAMWNPKKSLQSQAVLTNQPPAFAPGTRHTGVSGETNGIPSAGACRGKKRDTGHVFPVRWLQGPIQRQHAHRFPSSKTNIEGILESKQNPPFQAVQTALAERKHKNGAKINTQMKWKLPWGKLTEKHRQKISGRGKTTNFREITPA